MTPRNKEAREVREEVLIKFTKINKESGNIVIEIPTQGKLKAYPMINDEGTEVIRIKNLSEDIIIPITVLSTALERRE